MILSILNHQTCPHQTYHLSFAPWRCRLESSAWHSLTCGTIVAGRWRGQLLQEPLLKTLMGLGHQFHPSGRRQPQRERERVRVRGVKILKGKRGDPLPKQRGVVHPKRRQGLANVVARKQRRNPLQKAEAVVDPRQPLPGGSNQGKNRRPVFGKRSEMLLKRRSRGWLSTQASWRTGMLKHVFGD